VEVDSWGEVSDPALWGTFFVRGDRIRAPGSFRRKGVWETLLQKGSPSTL